MDVSAVLLRYCPHFQQHMDVDVSAAACRGIVQTSNSRRLWESALLRHHPSFKKQTDVGVSTVEVSHQLRTADGCGSQHCRGIVQTSNSRWMWESALSRYCTNFKQQTGVGVSTVEVLYKQQTGVGVSTVEVSYQLRTANGCGCQHSSLLRMLYRLPTTDGWSESVRHPNVLDCTEKWLTVSNQWSVNCEQGSPMHAMPPDSETTSWELVFRTLCQSTIMWPWPDEPDQNSHFVLSEYIYAFCVEQHQF